MKKKKIILICLILYLIIREIVLLNFSAYKSFFEINSSCNSTSEIRSHTFNSKYETLPQININSDEDYTFKFHGLDGIKPQQVESENVINVYISRHTDISLARYLPLLKPIEFS